MYTVLVSERPRPTFLWSDIMLVFILGILVVVIIAGISVWMSPGLTSILGEKDTEALTGSLLVLSPLILIVLGLIIIGLGPFFDKLRNRPRKSKK